VAHLRLSDTQNTLQLAIGIARGKKAEVWFRYRKPRCAAPSRAAIYTQTHYFALTRSHCVLRLEFKMVVAQDLHSKKLTSAAMFFQILKSGTIE
jgi:hypothetical protein